MPALSRDLAINEPPLYFWKHRGYSEADIQSVGAEIDSEHMAGIVTFDGQGGVSFRISSKTWERQQGHYPAVLKYFGMIGQRPKLRGKRGSIVVWLEDGLWEWQQKYSFRAPTLSFGRHIYDNHTFAIVDPAYMDSQGYLQDIEKIQAVENTMTFEDKQKTIFFRGAAVGLGIEHERAWEKTARGRLALLSKELANPTLLDAKFTKMNHLSPQQQQHLESEGVTGDYVQFSHFLRYLYLIHADGYCCSWPSLFTKLACSSLTVRILGEYEQWYYRDLIPWKHYVPLGPDLKEVPEIYEWLIAHDAAVKQMISNAQEFIKERLSFERVASETEELCAEILDCQRH